MKKGIYKRVTSFVLKSHGFVQHHTSSERNELWINNSNGKRVRRCYVNGVRCLEINGAVYSPDSAAALSYITTNAQLPSFEQPE